MKLKAVEGGDAFIHAVAQVVERQDREEREERAVRVQFHNCLC